MQFTERKLEELPVNITEDSQDSVHRVAGKHGYKWHR